MDVREIFRTTEGGSNKWNQNLYQFEGCLRLLGPGSDNLLGSDLRVKNCYERNIQVLSVQRKKPLAILKMTSRPLLGEKESITWDVGRRAACLSKDSGLSPQGKEPLVPEGNVSEVRGPSCFPQNCTLPMSLKPQVPPKENLLFLKHSYKEYTYVVLGDSSKRFRSQNLRSRTIPQTADVMLKAFGKRLSSCSSGTL